MYMIDSCGLGHQEIFFEGRICPLCDHREDRISEVEDLNERIDSLAFDNEKLQEKITQLEDMLREHDPNY